jgi:2,5-diketo-D-gluconate reductase A
VLLRWSLQRGAVPLPKANRRDHLAENLQAFEFELSTTDLDVLNSLNERYSSLGSLPYV